MSSIISLLCKPILDDSEAVLPELSLPENQLCDIKNKRN